MTTVADVLTFVETLAPRYMKEDWDRVGLNCGHSGAPVRRILVALDPFDQVCREAASWGADLLITHHALLFRPDFLTDSTAPGRNALFLIENRIAHINAHTNLDMAPGGVNDCLARALGLLDIQVLNPCGQDDQGRDWGLLRRGTVEEMPLEAFLAQVKANLGCPGLRYAHGGKPVRQVAVGGGSCASELEAVAKAGCDTFVTADVKYNGFWDARDLGINLIDAGHFFTENPVVPYLAEKLRAAFPETAVKISETHWDCMKFFG